MRNEMPAGPLPESAPRSASPRPARRRAPGFTFPLLLIFIGVMLLLGTTHVLTGNFWRLWILWPAVLILFGLDILLGRSPTLVRLAAAVVLLAALLAAGIYVVTIGGGEWTHFQQAYPLEGARRGEVKVDLGVGRVDVGALEQVDTPNWAEVDLTGIREGREPMIRREADAVRLEASQTNWTDIWPASWSGDIRWKVSLLPRLPLNRMDTHVGLGEIHLDLPRMQVQDLSADVGVGRIVVTLPAGSEGGQTHVRLHVGIGSIQVTVPEGVSAEIRAHAGLGSAAVDQNRFPRQGEVYRDCEGTCRLAIEVDVGIGTVDVR